ncbi:M20/M25/M40 family metallo-hydrolase [Longibacter sp.]|jgi:glutamate carboxypeptidase|uniref:M20/M25/M40 family metallo-hydrolase n=1 Tax=Longibacter sp. TaxID=2045415 RepID=UPI003EBBEAB1
MHPESVVPSSGADLSPPSEPFVAGLSPDVVDAVVATVESGKEAYVEFLETLVRIETPSTNPDTFGPAFDHLAGGLEEAGLISHHLPGTETAGSLYARPMGRRRHHPVQFMLGHVDTVWSLGTVNRMPVVRRNGALRGPGVFDMKAGLTTIVFALRALRALDLEPPADPVVLITSDEEIGSHESRRHIERLARCASRVFVTEPGLGLHGKIKTARKGTGEYAILLHPSGAPTETIVTEMVDLVQLLHDLNDAERGTTVNVGTLQGPGTGEPFGRLGVDVRVVTQNDADRVDRLLRSRVRKHVGEGIRVEIRGGVERPPMERTPGNRRLWHAARAIAEAMGEPLEEDRAGGASDGNFTSEYAPTLDGLGAVGDGAHAEHEFASIDATVRRCALLALLLMTPVKGGA